jgi:dihydroorotate dehydrogenase
MFLKFSTAAYRAARPLLFMPSAQQGHTALMRFLRMVDDSPALLAACKDTGRRADHGAGLPVNTQAGQVKLDRSLIVAAGLVKGTGFADEATALNAVERGENIMPGWASMPALAGIVEFGSFTPHPRPGNSGIVLWRDTATRSTQNRVGLKNPGANAAAAFLAARHERLPAIFGINIAPTPGSVDVMQERDEVIAAFNAFVERRVIPSWFTLNLSCPNTEDDPHGNQTESKARDLCGAVVSLLKQHGSTPLWVKVSPCLSKAQVAALMRAFADTGVSAVIATNTLPMPTRSDATVVAGVGGGRLHDAALESCRMLFAEKAAHGLEIDIIACGGILDGDSLAVFIEAGVSAAQYYSALLYRGLLAGAVIWREYGLKGQADD